MTKQGPFLNMPIFLRDINGWPKGKRNEKNYRERIVLLTYLSVFLWKNESLMVAQDLVILSFRRNPLISFPFFSNVFFFDKICIRYSNKLNQALSVPRNRVSLVSSFEFDTNLLLFSS